MLSRAHRWTLLAATLTLPVLPLSAQVFVVGEKSATAGLATDFKPTNVPLPSSKLTERGRRELLRNLEAEQGFAHRALPMGAGLTLKANGPISPGPDQYKKMIYEKGQSAGPGDRVAITALVFKGDRIILDLNGGPYAKHRFLSHVQFNDNNVVAAPAEKPTGARVTLVFEGPVPEISAPEVKALLDPVIDFGVKSSEQAYADTLPAGLRDAIAAHEVLVGMNRRMVIAALGAPESKVREKGPAEVGGANYEEWIYGHVPQTVRFVRFQGDRVSIVEIAEMGKPLQIHDEDETSGYLDPKPVHEIAMGDAQPSSETKGAAAPPTLRQPGEAVPDAAHGPGRVQFPEKKGTSGTGTDTRSSTNHDDPPAPAPDHVN